jgi:hypothetical protein
LLSAHRAVGDTASLGVGGVDDDERLGLRGVRLRPFANVELRKRCVLGVSSASG